MATYHGDVVEVVDEENGAQLLGLEGARQLHEQVHAGVAHAVQVVIQLPILYHQGHVMHARFHDDKLIHTYQLHIIERT